MIKFFEKDSDEYGDKPSIQFEVSFGYNDVGLESLGSGLRQAMFLTNIAPDKIGKDSWADREKSTEDIINDSQGVLHFENRESLETVIKWLNQLRDNMIEFENSNEN